MQVMELRWYDAHENYVLYLSINCHMHYHEGDLHILHAVYVWGKELRSGFNDD